MPSTLRVSTAAAGSPDAAASLMQRRFVEDDAGEALDGGFEDMRAWRAAERQGNFVAFDADGDLVLRAGEREAYSLVAGQERALREVPSGSRQVRAGESGR